MSMTHTRLGHKELSRTWLAKADLKLSKTANDPETSWTTRLELLQLQNEAHLLRLDSEFPADPFATDGQ